MFAIFKRKADQDADFARWNRPAVTRPQSVGGWKQSSFEPSDDAEGPLVLIVDDYEDDRILMSRMLRAVGFRVIEAASGDEALELFQDHTPQAVILDILMPRMGGFAACRMLRHLAGTDLPILVVSGLQDPGTVRRALDAGATEFMAKPDIEATLEDYASLAERLRLLCNSPGRASRPIPR